MKSLTIRIAVPFENFTLTQLISYSVIGFYNPARNETVQIEIVIYCGIFYFDLNRFIPRRIIESDYGVRY